MSDADALQIFTDLNLDIYSFSDGEIRLINDHWGIYSQRDAWGNRIFRLWDATTVKGQEMYAELTGNLAELERLRNAPGHGILGSEGPLAQGLTTIVSLSVVALVIFLFLKAKKGAI